MNQTLRDLLANLIDYAGLFPPAALDMTTAGRNYAAYRRSETSWMLGRFIVPAPQLPLLADAVVRDPHDAGGWTISAIVREHMDEDAAAVQAFNQRPATQHVRVDTIECRPSSSDGITWLAKTFSPAFTVHVELGVGPTVRGCRRVTWSSPPRRSRATWSR